MLTWTSKFPANKQSLAWKEAQLLAKRSK